MLGPSLLFTFISLTSSVLALPGPPSYHPDKPDPPAKKAPVSNITCAKKDYVYQELAGVGLLPGNGRDDQGDTLAGLGSAAQVDLKTWKWKGDHYEGVLYSVPDRGWNTEGTLNYNPRIHKFKITFKPAPDATVAKPSGPNVKLEYLSSILLKDPKGEPCTGLDPTGVASFKGLPDLPAATYKGDGFGVKKDGPEKTRVSVDSEGLVLNKDGSFWISDEYGPFVYLFDGYGKMITAIKPPQAIIPHRGGKESYYSATAPRYDPTKKYVPEESDTGRKNNRGFEGLGASADGKTLWVLLQSATNQEGGDKASTRRHTRFLKYDVSNKKQPKYEAEYIVPLPEFKDKNDENKTKAAAQSEVHALPNGQFLMLSRDSDAGASLKFSESSFRNIGVFDISMATDIKGKYDDETSSVAPKGVLVKEVKPAEVCDWIDFNLNDQLKRFRLHNGGAQDKSLLSEKWESISVVPVLDKKGKEVKNEYFILSINDNDFITQDGAMFGGKLPYKETDGKEVQNQALLFQVKMPF